MSAIKNLLKDESGQGMAEYALILAGIAIVVIAAINLLGPAIEDKLNKVGEGLGVESEQ